jgi:Domain of unknown function (DUF4185)
MKAPPPPEVHAVWHVGCAPAVATDEWTLVGQDGGQSIDLGGDVLFVFADTLLARTAAFNNSWPAARWPIRRDQGRFLANCCGRARRGWLPVELGQLRYSLGDDGWPQETLLATPFERLARVRFWPEHGVAIDGRVYLYYLGIEHYQPGGTWGFRNLGTGLALLDPVTGHAERLTWNGDWRLWPPVFDLHGGVQVIREGDTVYVFGACRNGHGVTARLARVDVSALAEPTAYEYCASDSPRWTRHAGESCSLGPCGHEFSVSFNRYLGKYLMCYVDSSGRALHLRCADSLWGPYSEPRNLGGLPLETRNAIAALAFEHPLFAADNGRTVTLSYCQPNFTPNGFVQVRFV